MSTNGVELRTATEERCPYCRSEEVDRFSSIGALKRQDGGGSLILKGYYCLGDDCLKPFIVQAAG